MREIGPVREISLMRNFSPMRKLASVRKLWSLQRASLLIGLLFPLWAHAAWETGDLLRKDCSSERATGRFYCYGYVVGVVEVLTGIGVLCTPPTVAKKDLRDQVVKFLNDNPTLLTEDADSLVYEALKEFDCKRVKSP